MFPYAYIEQTQRNITKPLRMELQYTVPPKFQTNHWDVHVQDRSEVYNKGFENQTDIGTIAYIKWETTYNVNITSLIAS